MTAIPRLALGVFLAALSCVNLACNRAGPTVSAQKLDTDAADAAAKIEKGDRMKNGDSKDVPTAFGIVTVKKEADGKMTYTRKNVSK